MPACRLPRLKARQATRDAPWQPPHLSCTASDSTCGSSVSCRGSSSCATARTPAGPACACSAAPAAASAAESCSRAASLASTASKWRPAAAYSPTLWAYQPAQWGREEQQVNQEGWLGWGRVLGSRWLLQAGRQGAVLHPPARQPGGRTRPRLPSCPPFHHPPSSICSEGIKSRSSVGKRPSSAPRPASRSAACRQGGRYGRQRRPSGTPSCEARSTQPI